uniref:Mitochondrial ribosomal protein L35 n=1 Tax=Ovis aries TaxID=9940 RepID=A0AC11D4V5_SHEEP
MRRPVLLLSRPFEEGGPFPSGKGDFPFRVALRRRLCYPKYRLLGILRPLNILASSAYRNCTKNVCLNSVLSSRHFSHIQTPVVSSAPRLITSVRSLTCGQTATVLNRMALLIPNVLKPPVRTVTYCSSRKGKRKTVKAVIYRFLRLHSGLWLRRKAGYKKKLWKKTVARKRRLREFVFCNKTQSKLLDKMTTSFWKRRNWYADDPYQMYHDRTNLKV